MPTVAGLFIRTDDAHRAVEDLVSEGWRQEDVGVVAPPCSNSNEADANLAFKDAEKGAVVGGLAGLFLGLSELAVPGVGLVLVGGWLAAALFGAGVGAAAGGLVGALVEAGVSHHEAEQLEHGVRTGATLITVKARAGSVDRVREILLRHRASKIELTSPVAAQ